MIELKNSSDDKETRIMISALNEFALYGYEVASTNSITVKANVSKGMLFHIFSSKKNLYLEVLNKCISDLSEKLNYCGLKNEDNFFEMIQKYSNAKLVFYIENPKVYALLCEAFYNTPKDLKEDITNLYTKLSKSNYSIIIKKFNEEKLREGIDRQKALDLILMTFDSLEKKYLSKLISTSNYGIDIINEINSDFMEYLELIERGIK